MVSNGTFVLKSHDEVFFIRLDEVLCFQADDHYSYVNYVSGQRNMLPFGLGAIETQLAEGSEQAAMMQRMGRKYIVNVDRIFRVNTVKEVIVFNDKSGNVLNIHVPKAVLRDFIGKMGE